MRFGDRVETVAAPSVLAIRPRGAEVIAAGYVFDTEMPDGNFIVLSNRHSLEGKEIKVRGRIKLYEGHPEVILETPDQLSLDH